MSYDPSVKSLVPTQKSQTAIANMLSYIRNELSEQDRDRVAKAIKNCQSCKRLYQELSTIFNPINVRAYELEYKEELERTDRLFQNVYDFYEPIHPQRFARRKNPKKEPEPIAEDCIGCGA